MLPWLELKAISLRSGHQLGLTFVTMLEELVPSVLLFPIETWTRWASMYPMSPNHIQAHIHVYTYSHGPCMSMSCFHLPQSGVTKPEGGSQAHG